LGINIFLSAQAEIGHFPLSSGKRENKHPKNPWPRPDIVNIVLLGELNEKCSFSMIIN